MLMPDVDIYERISSRILIILAKYPLVGHVKTRLGRSIGNAAAAQLYLAFLTDLAPRFLPQQQGLQFDVCWLYTPDTYDFKGLITRLQSENWSDTDAVQRSKHRMSFVGHPMPGLAEQQIQQLKWAHNLGYEQLMIITTDTPHLQRSTIENAFILLDSNEIVIGPTEDGGYYLLGMKKLWPVLENVAMSTHHVVNDIIRNAISSNLKVMQIDRMIDVDCMDDLRAFVSQVGPLEGAPCPQTWRTIQELGLCSFKCHDEL